jgi:uncharacterized membrane protein
VVHALICLLGGWYDITNRISRYAVLVWVIFLALGTAPFLLWTLGGLIAARVKGRPIRKPVIGMVLVGLCAILGALALANFDRIS